MVIADWQFCLSRNWLRPRRWSKSHNVVAAIHVNHFAGDAGAHVGSKEEGGIGHLADLHVALQWRALGVGLEHVAETGDAARRQRLDRPGRDGIHTNALRSEVVREVPDTGLERGLGYSHNVVVGNHLLGTEVGEGE